MLNSFIIVGLSILLEPTSVQSDELRSLLNVVTGRAPDEEGRVSEATVRELAIVELFTQKDQIVADSAPGSPSFARAQLHGAESGFQQMQSSQHAFSGAGKRSIMAQDFLGPPAASFSSSAVASAEPGQTFWGEKDPVDQLLIQYHRSRGEVANQQQQQQQFASGSQPKLEGNDAWSEVPRGLAEHSVQGPAFSASPHHSQHHHHQMQQYPAQSPSSSSHLHPNYTSQQRSSLSPSSASGGPSAQYPFAPPGSSGGGAMSFGPFGFGGSGMVGVVPGQDFGGGGAGGQGNGSGSGGGHQQHAGEMAFLAPWSHHAGGLGVGAGASEEVDLLGDAKELAFLNQLISAISSGDGPSQ